MKRLNNLKNILIEMGQLLSSSEKLQRLLILDTNDALDINDFEVKDFNYLSDEKYISFIPSENAIKNLGKNTFIILSLDSSNYRSCIGSIYIGTDESHMILNRNRFRLFEMVDEIGRVLDGVKISAAGKINVRDFNKLSYSEFTYGYKITFTTEDQTNEGAEL